MRGLLKKQSNVDMSQAPEVHFHDSLRFCTTFTLHLLLDGTCCHASVRAQRDRMKHATVYNYARLDHAGGGGGLGWVSACA